MMTNQSTIDLTALSIELFKTRATILAYANATMTIEQKNVFNDEYSKHLKIIIEDFVEKNRDNIAGLNS